MDEANGYRNLLGAGQRTLVMLSGGGDSVALLDLAVRDCGPGDVVALHVNYGLRPGSDADAAFCRELCEQLKVTVHIERVELPNRGNLHDAAREARYRLAEALADRERCDVIAVAHTADDQAETVLYRLLASPGRRALLGMEPRRGRLVRPLLGARREELRRYLRERGLNWREDVSNSDPAFARARVRELLAAAGTIHPAAIDNVLRTADELRAESIALDAIVAELLANALDVEGESLQVAALAQLPAALQALVLREFVERAAGRPVPDARRQAARIVELAAGGGSSTLQIEGAELIVEYGKLRVARESPEMPAIEVKLAVPGTAEFGSWIVEASIGEAALPPAGVDTATFGASTLASILTVRPRRDGDRMRPRGLGGSKSLQDLFVDHKVPKRLRDRHPVICSGDEIIWIPGVAVADGYAPMDGSDTAVLSARA